MDVFSQGDASLALGKRMSKPFGLFKTPIDPVNHNRLPANSGDVPNDFRAKIRTRIIMTR